MTDNFEIVKQFIKTVEPDFDLNDDKFYTVEIIRRKKDNTNQNICSNTHSNTADIKTFYINKISDFDKYKSDIIKLCEVFNARAYVPVNCKSYEHITKSTMVEIANRIANNDYKKPQTIFQSCTGKYINNKKKIWIVDIDVEDAIKSGISVNKLTEIVESAIEKSESYRKPIISIPSKTGKHVVTYGFNVIQFEKETANFIDRSSIKRNNQAVLYTV